MVKDGDPHSASAPREATSRERMINRVVIALVDGQRKKGFVYDLDTEDDEFHLFSSDDPNESRAEVLCLDDCKAVYFVRSHTGNPAYEENKTDLPARKRFGRPLRVVFGDGEIIVGTVEVYNAKRRGFYLIPPDPRSNNLRILVIAKHTREVELLNLGGEGGEGGKWEVPDPARYGAPKRVEVVRRILRGATLDAVSMDVFIPPRVLHHWREIFVQGGGEALTDAALTAAGGGPGPRRLEPGQRTEAVLRLCANESEAVVSQETLVPLRTLSSWKTAFLAAGEAALKAFSEQESGGPLDEVRRKYETLPEPGQAADPGGDIGDFLDGLTGSI